MILLVDDDPTTNFLHRRAVSKVMLDTTVEEASDGCAALELLRLRLAQGEQPPEFIFLDINMPKLDGWGFLNGYRHLPASMRRCTRVVVLTTSLNPDDHERALTYPDVVAVVDKILTREKLEQLLLDHRPALPTAA